MLTQSVILIILLLVGGMFLINNSHEFFQSGSVPWYLANKVENKYYDPSYVDDRIRQKYQQVETVADIMEGSIGFRDGSPNEGVGNNKCKWYLPSEQLPADCQRRLGVGGCVNMLPTVLYYFNTYNREKGLVPEADHLTIENQQGDLIGLGMINKQGEYLMEGQGAVHYQTGDLNDGEVGKRSGTCWYDVTPYRYEKSRPSVTGDRISKLVRLPKTRLGIKLTEAEKL